MYGRNGRRRTEEAHVFDLVETLEREVKRLHERGYVFIDPGNMLERAKENLNKLYKEGHVERYEKGFDAIRRKQFDDIEEDLLRVKGGLINLKIQKLTRESRHLNGEGPLGEHPIVNIPISASPEEGAFTSWQQEGISPAMWVRGVCRPTRKGVQQIEKLHQQGKKTWTYMSGGMVAITFALLPWAEEEWTDDFMSAYAREYNEEMCAGCNPTQLLNGRFWGARGTSDEWGWWIPYRYSFNKWMISQLEFVVRLGFDCIHLDECFGDYAESRRLIDKNPDFVVDVNNFARMNIDQDEFRYGFLSMGEVVGHPKDWDAYIDNMRNRAKYARNISWWGWMCVYDKGFYGDLHYASVLANKGVDVSYPHPSLEYYEFSKTYSDYLIGSYVDIYISQDAVKCADAPDSFRMLVNRRVLESGKEEVIAHLFNIDPEIKEISGLDIEININGLQSGSNTHITFMTPENGVVEIEAQEKDGILRVNVPAYKIWGILVAGERIIPSVAMELEKRDGCYINKKFDNKFIPGEEIMVKAVMKDTEGCSIELNVPEGWKYKLIDSNCEEGFYRYSVIPLYACKDEGYVITPIVKCNGEKMPSWPLHLQAKDHVELKLTPPMAEYTGKWEDFSIEVKNNSVSGNIKFKINPPEDWQFSETEHTVNVEGGDTALVELSMLIPDNSLNFWDFQDIFIPVEWEFNGINSSSELFIRVFPSLFYVYAEGVEKLIMHGYPNVYYKDSYEDALESLKKGEFVALWLVNREPAEYKVKIDEFIAAGGGVIWMGKPFEGDNCPAVLIEENVKEKFLTYDIASTNARLITFEDSSSNQNVLDFPLAKRINFAMQEGYDAYRIEEKEWGSVIGRWSATISAGTPAVVMSNDKSRRVVYFGSDMAATSEKLYRFEERRHRLGQWHQTYIYYRLLNWAATGKL